ncbi:MAG: 16S rRNA (adenine(1518)-N(6)/adenine(1519)-N(6))-dimethyltransferase RsmA [Enterobacteriaceae bacterium]|nr:16S rRNA (adenine(1518)-N(6)/adenine(1519)-N(6))-dimethyltransferase RsmA [Enterobacteriaceae bacterium]
MKIFIKKNLGQHFLTNKKIINTIISSMNISENDIIIEIGPGTGVLTSHLEKKAKELHIIEIDTNLIPILKTKFNFSNKVHIYNQDILKININEITNNNKNIRIIGNIPYKISTKLIFNLIKFKKNIKDIFLMLQKEVVLRMMANKSTKNYGRLSITAQCNYEIMQIIENIQPQCFYPKPKVNSTFIKLLPNENKYKIKNYEAFEQIIREAFSQRRKKITKLLNKLNLKIKEIDPNKRPEDLSIDEYISISNSTKD